MNGRRREGDRGARCVAPIASSVSAASSEAPTTRRVPARFDRSACPCRPCDPSSLRGHVHPRLEADTYTRDRALGR